jgi:hypothetical protein
MLRKVAFSQFASAPFYNVLHCKPNGAYLINQSNISKATPPKASSVTGKYLQKSESQNKASLDPYTLYV